jgi:hypothetical protein
MQVVGNLVYVLLRNQGLSILDMSDPVHPVVRGKFALSAYGDSFYPNLSVTNNRVYISVGGNTGLHLVTLDVTNPASPSLLANALVSGYLAAVSGNLAYLTDDLFFGNLQIWDISDPSNPLLRSTPPLTVKKVQIVGGLAYVIDTSYPFGPQNGLWILDISDPAHPSIRGSYTRYEINGVAVPESGQRAYVDGDWFQILDLTNPISPSLRGSHIDPNDTGLNRLRTPLYIAGTHVYASNVHWPFNTLLSFDVTNPDAPALSSSTTLTGTIAAITGMNNLIYVLSYTQYFVPSQWSYYTYLTILDISDPSNPIILGRINELTYSHYQPPGAITLAGTLAYLATGDTLDIIDVGDPAHPQVRTHYDTPGHASDVQIIGDLAYVADAEAGLSILDISDRLKPTIHGRYIGSPGFNVFTKDGLAYLNTGDMILLVDLHELSRPVPRASYSRVRGQFQVVGDLIYVAGGSQGLQILRIHPDRFPSPAFLPLVRR